MTEQTQEQKLPPQSVRIAQEPAEEQVIVPGLLPSSSDEGPSGVLPTGIPDDRTTVEEYCKTLEELCGEEEMASQDPSQDPQRLKNLQGSMSSITEAFCSAAESTPESFKGSQGAIDMEVEEDSRKKRRQSSSEEEETAEINTPIRKRVIVDDDEESAAEETPIQEAVQVIEGDHRDETTPVVEAPIEKTGDISAAPAEKTGDIPVAEVVEVGDKSPVIIISSDDGAGNTIRKKKKGKKKEDMERNNNEEKGNRSSRKKKEDT